MEDVEPTPTKWTSPMLFAPNGDGTLQFGMDYYKLKAVTIRDCIQTLQMSDCINYLDDARFSWHWTLTAATEEWRHRWRLRQTSFTFQHGLFGFIPNQFNLKTFIDVPMRNRHHIIFGKWQLAPVCLDNMVKFSQVPKITYQLGTTSKPRLNHAGWR